MESNKYPDICSMCPVNEESVCDPDNCKSNRQEFRRHLFAATAAIEKNSAIESEETTRKSLNSLIRMSNGLYIVDALVAAEEAKC